MCHAVICHAVVTGVLSQPCENENETARLNGGRQVEWQVCEECIVTSLTWLLSCLGTLYSQI